MIKQAGIDFRKLHDEEADSPLGEYSGAATIFGATGGVMTAALRTAYFYITGEELGNLDFKEIDGLEGIKACEVDIKGTKVRIAVDTASATLNRFWTRFAPPGKTARKCLITLLRLWPAAAAALPAADNPGS